MTAPLPNPFVLDADAVDATDTASRFTLDEERFYADMVGAPDDMPLFLRRPSHAFMAALFNLSDDSDRYLDRETGSDRRYD